MKIKTTVIERAMPPNNQFKIPGPELDRYVEVVVTASTKGCKASSSISFPRELEKYSKSNPEVKEAIKKALDMAKGNLLKYMKDRGLLKETKTETR